MQVKCVNCGTTWNLPEPSVGKVLKCGKCGTKFVLEVVRYLDEPVDSPGAGAPPVETSRAVSPLDQLAASGAPQSAHTYRAARSAGSRYKSSRSYSKGIPKWVIPVAVVAILGVGFLILRGSGLLSRAGLSATNTDIRKVIANPEAYAGRTLESRVITEGIDAGGRIAVRGIGATGGIPLFLTTSPSLEEKSNRILLSVGKHQSVMIKYRIHDKATFAKIKAHEAAEERAEANARKSLEAGPDRGTIDVDIKLQRMQEARAKAREREVGDKDPADFSGTLIAIWIP